jgi:hypothetical protein
VARPERFELPTTWFEAKCSIQLSYGRVGRNSICCANFSGEIVARETAGNPSMTRDQIRFANLSNSG